MKPRYCVQRLNTEEKRFEWLAADPAEDELLRGDDVTWTAKASEAADLDPARAQAVVPLVVGASFVRFGDAPPEEVTNFAAVERRRVEEARAVRIDAIATEAEKRGDLEAAEAAIAMLPPELRAAHEERLEARAAASAEAT